MSDNDTTEEKKDINGMMQEALKAFLIIEQQQDMLKEILPTIVDNFGVNKPTAKKILAAYAKDTLEKTSEKMEDERNSLANAETMISAVENVVVAPDPTGDDSE